VTFQIPMRYGDGFEGMMMMKARTRMSDSGRTMRTPLEIQLEHFRRRGVTTGDAIAELFQRCDEKDARIAELEASLVAARDRIVELEKLLGKPIASYWVEGPDE